MSRQDANAAFAPALVPLRGNADYLENLYARYETTPLRSMPSGRRSSKA